MRDAGEKLGRGLRQLNRSQFWSLYRHPLFWLLLLAGLPRLALAFWPNVHAPDEIYQAIEPAWRILGHKSFVSWEWRYGIRSWTLPTLLSAPIALGSWLAPGGPGLFFAPRVVFALASLALVASAFGFGARLSRLHGLVAGLVAAIWFELIYFAPHTLGEPIATAIILWAAFLLTSSPLTSRVAATAGALLALATVCRFQFAPAIGVLIVGACWTQRQRLLQILQGGAVVIFACGLIDALHGAVPYAWLVKNIAQNLVHGRASTFGTSPALEYLGNFWVLWSVALVPIALAILFGARRFPLLLAVALTNLVFHSLIAHKEHRFVFLTVAAFIILAAIGSADWIKALERRPGWRPWATPLVAGGWIASSLFLSATGVMPDLWWRGIGAMELARAVRTDKGTCGVALFEVPYLMLPGRENLAGGKPIYAFDAHDHRVGNGTMSAARDASPSFNRLLSRRAMASNLPTNFMQKQCALFYESEVCLYIRDGGCDAAPGAPFMLDDVLARLDL